MQYAVIATGGKQYIASPGKQLVVETLPQAEGQTVSFDQVLLSVDGDSVQVGTPMIDGLSVTGTVLKHELADKIRVFKYKAKSRYRRTTGHRQHQTVVLIEAIGKAKPAKAEKATTSTSTTRKSTKE